MGRDSANRPKLLPVKLKRDNFARKPTVPFIVLPCPSALGNLPRCTDAHRIANQSKVLPGGAWGQDNRGVWSGSSGSSQLVGDTNLSHQSKEGNNLQDSHCLREKQAHCAGRVRLSLT